MLGLIPTTSNTAGVAVSPDGRALLAPTNNDEEDFILVVNLTTNAEVGAVMCDAAPCVYVDTAPGIAFNATGTRAYAIDAGANELITIDTTDPLHPEELSRTPILALGTPWELDIEGTRLYVVVIAEPSQVVVFDIATDPPVHQLILPLGLAGLGASELDVWGPATVPTSKDQCEGDGWKTSGEFKNRGDCVSFVASKGKNKPARRA